MELPCPTTICNNVYVQLSSSYCVVSLSKTLYPQHKVLVQPKKTGNLTNMTEKLMRNNYVYLFFPSV